MSKKSTGNDEPSTFRIPDGMKDSAQHIWLAGLGAFTKAQQEGGKMFDTLVKEGTAMQRKAQAVAGEKFSETSQKMGRMANELGTKATGQWDKIEGLFEDRVARALGRLGMPTAQDMQALNDRLDALERRLPASRARKTPAKKALVKKAPAKKAAARPRTAAARKKSA